MPAPSNPAPPTSSEPCAPVLTHAATDAQRSCYLECAVATMCAIEDAIALLTARQVLPVLASDERRLITVELADLEARRVKVRAQMYAFIAGQQAIRPPSKDDLDKVKELAKKLDALTAQATFTRTVLDATSELLALYNRAVEL